MYILTLGKACQFLLALATLRIMTYFLPPEEVGKLTLLLSIIGFFALLLVNPVGMYINRKLISWIDAGTAISYAVPFFFYLLILGIFSALMVLLLMSTGILESLIPVSGVIGCVFASIVFGSVNQTLIPSFLLLKRELTYSLLTLATILSGLIISIAIIFSTGYRTGIYWLGGSIIGQTIFSAVAAFIFFKIVSIEKPNFNRNIKKLGLMQLSAGFFYCFPIMVASGANWLQYQFYRFYVSVEIGLAEFGMFAVGYGLAASLVSAIDQVLTTMFQPVFYRSVNNSNQDIRFNAWNQYATLMLPGLIIGSTWVISLANEFVQIFLDVKYRTVTDFVMLGVVSEFFRAVYSVFSLLPHSQMRTKMLLIPSISGALVSTSLIYYGLPVYGVVFVPIGLLVGAVCSMVILYITSRNKLENCKIPIEWAAYFLPMPIIMYLCSHYEIISLNSHLYDLAVKIAFYTFLSIPFFYYLVIKNGYNYRKN